MPIGPLRRSGMSSHPNHREHLIQAALRLFRRQGYAGTGLREILEHSKAPKGSLYHYFPGGKEELGREALAAGGRAVERTLDGILASTRTGDEFILRYMHGLADWLAQSGFRDGCPIATTILELAPDSTPISEAGKAAIDRWIERISQAFIRDGMQEQVARDRALLTVAVTEGALIVARAQRSAEPIRVAALQLVGLSASTSPAWPDETITGAAASSETATETSVPERSIS